MNDIVGTPGDARGDTRGAETLALAAPIRVVLRKDGFADKTVAVDPAGGGSEGDYSAIEVLDLESGLQCAEFAGHVGGLELMELARQVGWDYNTAWLAVERNNHGSGLLCLLEEKGYREIFKGTDGQRGYLTTSVSRPAMLARMSAALVEEPRLLARLLATLLVALPTDDVMIRPPIPVRA